MRTALRFFYRNVILTGTENIPSEGPIVLIANHASSVMDALLLGVLLKRPVHFFARGDMFHNSVARWLMNKIHMMPVHHHQTGRNSISKNDESFEYAKTLLQKGEMILFFPEGTSHVEYELYPFKKGVFRIAFEFMHNAQWRISLPCVPIGITYDHPTEAHHNVTVNIGASFLLNTYQQTFLKNEAAALLQCSKDAYQKMLPLVIHINNKKRVDEAQQMIQMKINDRIENKNSWVVDNNESFIGIKKMAAAINEMDDMHWQKISNSFTSYQNALAANKCTDAVLTEATKNEITYFDYFVFVAGFPLFVFSWLLNSLPLKIAKYIADKKVYRNDFYSWIWMTFSEVLYLIWLVVLFAGFSIISFTTGLMVVAIVLAGGLYMTFYSKKWKRVMKHRKWNAYAKNIQQQLMEKRKNVLGYFSISQ